MSAEQVRVFTVTEEDDGIRLDRWFRRNLPEASFGTVARWARTGQLRLDGKRAAPGDRILAGQQIRVPPQGEEPQAPARPQPKRIVLTPDETAFVRSMVIHEDAAAIVVNKPPGLATQGGTKTHDHLDRLLDGLAAEGAPRPKLVHRLDKDTSGALLVARTPRAAAFFSRAFAGRTARKVYWALVIGVPSVADGMIDLPLAKQPGTGGEKMHVDEAEGAPARTRYRVIERAGNRAAWVELQPHTGRTHQLRVHMAAIGHPIVGDGKYAGQDAFLTGSISRKLHLHARRLRIDHPDDGRVDVTADLPEHFSQSLAALGFDLALGDLPLDEVKYGETAEGKRKAVSAAAKARRKERRGERRNRSRELMHPDGRFDWQDRGAILAFVAERAFATLFVPAAGEGFVVHVPLIVQDEARLRFHIARRNRAVPALDGARAWLSCTGIDAYISPDWYGSDDQVPTWNYVAVEIEGQVRRLDDDALVDQTDRLSAAHEDRLLPKTPWTRHKMTPGRFEAMTKAIVGYELGIDAIRGTRKLGQNKRADEIEGAAVGLAASGREDMAALMRAENAQK